ncbi:MAG: hypothetical protein EOO20_26525 [Chryseobacterium sp.]|nr:MAG: hypothetical protein EOO20_26525 [Chryseobacterium sp.]
MNTNPILGRYDMVLALSQDKINAEFENLYDDGDIENTLEFLTDITGTKRLTSKSPDYASIKKSWLEQENLSKSLSTLDQDLTLLSDQQSKALEEDDFTLAKYLSEKLKVKRKELESLRKNTSEVNGYSYLIDARIKSPEIQILSGNNSNLLYKLRFESGSLYSLVEHKIRKTDLSEKIYAFNVPVGKIQIFEYWKINSNTSVDWRILGNHRFYKTSLEYSGVSIFGEIFILGLHQKIECASAVN